MIFKSQQDVADALISRLQTTTPLTDLDPGSIARAFVDVLTEEFYEFYNNLDVIATMSFVSTAQGAFLDLIGALLNCTRNIGEADSNYRSRITNQVYVVAGANITSIRLQALAVSGVKDIITKEFSKGAGSFAVYVITDAPQTPQDILNQVDTIVQANKAFGVQAEVKSPDLITIDLLVRLIFNDSLAESERASIRQVAKQALNDYISNIALGGTFTISTAIKTIMDSSPKIVDGNIYAMRVNNVPTYVKNVTAGWDERLLLNQVDMS